MKRYAGIALVNLVVIGVLLTLIELLAWNQNRKLESGARPLFFDAVQYRARTPGVRQVGTTTKMSFIDPHLGHAHDPQADLRVNGDQTISGFVVYGDPEVEDTLRIFTLGGSTTDPLDRDNWPKALYEQFESFSISVVVYNGGVSGYSSNQELLKLIRDVLPLAPDLVISLNGVNDMGFVHSDRDHPMVHPYQVRLFSSIVDTEPPAFLPNSVELGRRFLKSLAPDLNRIDGISYGTQVKTTPHEQWLRNVRLMHAAASEFGVAYVCFLQPTLGFGNYQPNEMEKALLADAVRARGTKYLQQVESYYSRARPYAESFDYIVDMTDVFSETTGVYRDVRHPNAEGYALIAKSMFGELDAREILDWVRSVRVRKVYTSFQDRFKRNYESGTNEVTQASGVSRSSVLVEREERLGVSLPSGTGGHIVHWTSEDFYLAGWYIADELRSVRAEFNGASYAPQYVSRRDVESKYPEYKYKVGWIFRIPIEEVRTSNTMALFFGDKSSYTFTIEVPPR